MLTNVLFGQVLSATNDPAPSKAADSSTRQHGKSFSDHLDGQRDRADTKDRTDTKVTSPESASQNTSDSKASEASETDSPQVAAKDSELHESGSAGGQERATDSNPADAGSEDANPDQSDALAGDVADDSDAHAEDLTADTVDLAEQPEATAVQAPDAKVAESQQRDVTTVSSITPKASSSVAAAGGGTGDSAANGNSIAIDADTNSTVASSETSGGSQAELPKGTAGETAVVEALRRQAETAKATVPSQTSEVKTTGQTAVSLMQQTETQKLADAQETGTRFAGLQDGATQSAPASDTPKTASTRPSGDMPPQKPTGASSAASANAAETDPTALGEGGAAVEEGEITRLAGDASRGAGSASQAAATVAGQAAGAAVTNSNEPGRRAQARAAESREASLTGTAETENATTRTTTPTTPQVSAVQQAFAAQALAGEQAGSGAQSDASVLSGEPGPDMPGLSQLLTEAVLQPGTTHRPETPRMVAVQLAGAFAAKGERNVDVALNPEELGRVKMRVTTSEAGITVVIQTERPETGDLMRRHINELADEFRKMGFEDISFEFSGGQTSGGQSEGDGEAGSGKGRGLSGKSDDMAAAEVADTAIQHLRLGASGVDMRV